MNSFPFPRTYRDLEKARWCHSVELPNKAAQYACFIHIREDWFPEDYGDVMSASGATLKEALMDLRGLWEDMRPPESV